MKTINNFYKKITIFVTIILSTLLISNICTAETETNIQSKIKKCIACHTITGNSLVPMWPKIAEQHPDYLFKQMLEFKKGPSGNRFDPNMFAMLQGLNEKDMKDIAIYFSKQLIETKVKQKKNRHEIIAGKNLYIYGDKKSNIVACVGCHAIDGKGNKLANLPSLKWQHKEYLITQLKKFKTGDRSNDINGIMRDITTNMTEKQMDALAAYISCIE